jgi:integrase
MGKKETWLRVPSSAQTKAAPGKDYKAGPKVTRPVTRPAVLALRAEFFNNKNSVMEKLWTKPTIYKDPKNVDWYLYYYFRHPLTGKMERFKDRFEMNRWKDLKERQAYAVECVKFMTDQLKAGFNPYSSVKVSDMHAGVLKQLEVIASQLTDGKSKSLKESTTRAMNSFSAWVKAEDYSEVGLHLFTVDTCREYQNYLVRRKLSGKTINGLISSCGVWWDHAISQGIAGENPWRQLKPVKRSQDNSDLFAPITQAEIKTIFAHLRNTGQQNFVNFLCFIYYAFARPVEIVRLRIGDIDLDRNLITFRKGNTKNGQGANVQIVPPFKKVLLAMNLQNYPQDYYIFSTIDMQPGPIPRPDNITTKMWATKVIRGLGIQKNMYALKHTGNIDYLINNKGKVDLKWQQMQNRHSSAAMTERYCRRLGAYFVDTDALCFNEI